MTKPKEKPAKEKPQIERFKDAARELDCDESPEAFEDSFTRIVPPKSGTNGTDGDEKA